MTKKRKDKILDSDPFSSTEHLVTNMKTSNSGTNSKNVPGAEAVQTESTASHLESTTYETGEMDDAILRAQGHVAAMPRTFTKWDALGFGFGITQSWIAAMGNFGQNLVYGGPQTAVFSILVAVVLQWIVTLGLSELASAFPSTGGQYHFTHILAPEKYRRGLAFTVGWLSVIAWFIVTASGVSVPAMGIFAMANFWHPEVEITRWRVYLGFLIVVAITVAPVLLAPKAIPKIAQTTLYLSVTGCCVIFIVLAAMKKQTNPGSYILESGLGSSGWDDRTAWLLSISNFMYLFAATDAAIHIAEEMDHPGRTLPMVMNSTMAIGFSTAFPLVLLMMFAMKDMEAVIAAFLPSIEIIYQITGSKSVTTFLMSWLLLVFALAVTPQWVTCGRMTWAFARDNGMPWSDYFSKIDEKRDFPLRTTVLAVGFVCLYGLLYLASSTAYNSIITSAVLGLNITYAIPQAILVLRGRDKCLPNRPLRLGWVGYVCNIFSPLWVIVLAVLVCLPPGGPDVTAANMNYSSPIIVGLFILVVIFWYTGGKERYQGPKIDMEALNQWVSSGMNARE